MGSLGPLQYLKVESDGSLKTTTSGTEPILHRSSTAIDQAFPGDKAAIAKQLAEDMPRNESGSSSACEFSVETALPETPRVYTDLVGLLHNHLERFLPWTVPVNMSNWTRLAVSYTRDRSQPVSFTCTEPTVILNIGSEQTIHLQTRHSTIVVDVPMPPLSVLCLPSTMTWTDIQVVRGHEGGEPDHHFWVSLQESDCKSTTPPDEAGDAVSTRSRSPGREHDSEPEGENPTPDPCNANNESMERESITSSKSRSTLSNPPSVKSPTPSSSIDSQCPGFDGNLFIHWETALQVVNTVRVSTLNKLIDLAPLKRSNQDTYSARQMLLEHLQKIYEGQAVLTPGLCNLMLDQLTTGAIDKEIERLELTCQGSQLKSKKQALADNWCRPAMANNSPTKASPEKAQKAQKKREKKRKKKLQKTLSGGSSIPEEEGLSDPKDPDPPLAPIAKTDEVPETLTESNNKPLKILEMSVLELKADVANNRHLVDLLIDQDPGPSRKKKGSEPVNSDMKDLTAKISELTEVNKSVIQQLDKQAEANLTLAKSVEKLAEQNLGLANEIEKLKAANRSLSDALQTAMDRIRALEERGTPMEGPSTSRSGSRDMNMIDLKASNKALTESHANTLRRLQALEQKFSSDATPTVNTSTNVTGQPSQSFASVVVRNSANDNPANEEQTRSIQQPGASETVRTDRGRIRSARSRVSSGARESYRQHSVLVVHDGLFDNFNQDAFPRHLRLKLVKNKSLKTLATTELNALIRTMERTRPKCVYIHAGWNDAFESIPSQEVSEYCRTISEAILSAPTVNANVCFSTPFHVGSDNSALADRVEETSQTIFQFVSRYRTQSERVFSFTNDELWNFTTQYSGEPGPVRPSCERGTKIMWASLRNGISKTLRLPNPRNTRHNE